MTDKMACTKNTKGKLQQILTENERTTTVAAAASAKSFLKYSKLFIVMKNTKQAKKLASRLFFFIKKTSVFFSKADFCVLKSSVEKMSLKVNEINFSIFLC